MKNVLTRILIFLVVTLQISYTFAAGSTEMRNELTTIDATLRVERSGVIEGEWHSDDIHPVFGFIPGSIFGSPLDDIDLPVRVDDESRFVVELSDWTAKVEAAAKPLSEMNRELGLRVQPADTRLLRISTFAYDFKHDSFMDGAFKEERGNGHAVLIYTDRPCDIFGEVTLGGEEYTLDISLPSRGFHFLLTDDNNHATRRRARNGLLFVTNH